MHKILIVEDDEPTRTLMSSILMKAGFMVKTAENGNTAIILLRRHEIDILIIDLIMPEMDGLRLLESIRENSRTQDIPAILCSSVKDQEKVKKAVSLGINDYVLKPFTKQSLLEKVQKVADEIPLEFDENDEATGEPIAHVVDTPSPRPKPEVKPSATPETSGWDAISETITQETEQVVDATSPEPEVKLSANPETSGWDALDDISEQEIVHVADPPSPEPEVKPNVNRESSGEDVLESQTPPTEDVIKIEINDISENQTQSEARNTVKTFLPNMIEEMKKELKIAGKKLETGELNDMCKLVKRLSSFSEQVNNPELQHFASDFNDTLENINEQRRHALLSMRTKIHKLTQYLDKI